MAGDTTVGSGKRLTERMTRLTSQDGKEEEWTRKKTLERARQDEREGKSASTQAGEFVREEMEHVRQGKHGARSSQQAVAIGLSKARRAGIKLPPPSKGKTSAKTRKQAERDYEKGQSGGRTLPRRGDRGASGKR